MGASIMKIVYGHEGEASYFFSFLHHLNAQLYLAVQKNGDPFITLAERGVAALSAAAVSFLVNIVPASA